MEVLDRTQAPPFQNISYVDIVEAKSSYLDNGIPLHTIQAGDQLVVGLEIIFHAGNWYEPKKGVSYFTSKMLAEGTKTMSGPEIMEKISQYGAFMETAHSLDQISISVYCLSRYLKNILPIVADMITDSVFPEEEIQNLQRITLQNLKVNHLKTSYLASVRFREMLYGSKHAYGAPMLEENIAAITRDDLFDFYSKKILTAHCEVILSGQFTDEHLKQVNDVLGSIPRNVQPTDIRSMVLSGEESKMDTIVRPDSIQSSVRVGRRLFARTHPDYLKVKVLNEILGGYFGSRLMKNIREEKGYTYGIHSSLAMLQHDGYLVIGTDVNKDVAQLTVDEIFKEIDRLKKELVPQDELQTVKSYMLGSFASSITTPFALADKFKNIHFNGLGYEYYKRMIETYNSVSSEELLELAQRYFDEKEMVVVIAG